MKLRISMVCFTAAILLDLSVLLAVYRGTSLEETAFLAVFGLLNLVAAVYLWLSGD